MRGRGGWLMKRTLGLHGKTENDSGEPGGGRAVVGG